MQKQFKVHRVLTFATLLALLLTGLSTQAQSTTGRGTVKVMTYNMFQGTDFVEVLNAKSLPEFALAAQQTLQDVGDSKIPDRAKAVAHQIAITNPDLVALQEATLWRYGIGMNPTTVLYDPLQNVLDELRAEGSHYRAAVIADEYELQGPMPDGMHVLRATGRNVILARTDLPALQLSNPKTGTFKYLLSFWDDAIGDYITINRGWGSVDVDLHGRRFTFIATHIENTWPLPGIINLLRAQVAELNYVAASAGQQVIVAGDFNSVANDPNDPSHQVYEDMLNYGFVDSWMEVDPNKSGLTWPLINSSSTDTAYQRIDYIFLRGQLNARVVSLGGDKKQDRVDNMWPSDHAGLRALLQIGAE